MTHTKPIKIVSHRGSSISTAIPTVQRTQTQPPVQFARPHGLRLKGASDQTGIPYVEFAIRDVRWFTRLVDIDSKAARAQLEARNIILTKTERENLHAEVDGLTDFPPILLAERPGWNGPCFVSIDGEVSTPPGIEPAVPLFDQTCRKSRSAGTLEEWKGTVVRLVGRSNVPAFAIMIPFVSPLLALTGQFGNQGFNFVSSDREKLDSLQRLASSVVGNLDGTTRDRCALSGTIEPLELIRSLERFADISPIITDVDLCAASATDRVRGATLHKLLVGLKDGSPTIKPGTRPADPARFVFMLTSTESVCRILARIRPIANDRAAEHVFTVPAGGPFKRAGTASKVQRATSAQHGTAMAHFVASVVVARQAGERALCNRLAEWRSKFRARVTSTVGGVAAESAIEAFGLVYAAGKLAKAYGALPQSLDCMRAAIACYDAHRTTAAGAAPFLDRLKALANNPLTLRVDPNNLPSMSDAELDRLPAILRANPRGKDELLLTPAALGRAFPNKKLLFRDPNLVGIIKYDGNRHTVKRAIRIEKQSDRVVCITLP